MGSVRRPKPTYASRTIVSSYKNRKSPHPQQQETKMVIEKAASHIQQQETSKMIPYLSTKMMLQSLWRRRQKQWRDGYCSHVLLAGSSSHNFFVNTARVNCASVCHQRSSWESCQAGARQFFNT